ncbi:MAG: hypothetical protein R2836_01980 [Chitinophagales bacterium]|nr:hypothetical protein [Bacteroidota bacterium]MCB9227262.1 hypothetical protein [Chitinophagales bacterium]
MKYTKTTLNKAEKLLEDIDFIVRYEKGNFNSGYCLLEDKKVVVINKYFEIEAKVSSLIDIIMKLKFNTKDLSEESQKFYLQISQLELGDLE